MDGEDSFLDERVGPDLREQLGLRDQLARATRKRSQDVERLRRQMHVCGAAREPPLRDVERDVAELVPLRSCHRNSANLSRTFETCSARTAYPSSSHIRRRDR